MLKSRTTQNVAAGTAASGGLALVALQWLRAVWPEMPGDAESDMALAVVLTTFLGPVASRYLAFLRDPSKVKRGRAPEVGQ